MASTPSPQTSSPTPGSSPASEGPPAIATAGAPSPSAPPPELDVVKFRDTDDGKKLAAWVRSEYDKMKTARKQKEMLWYLNMSMVAGAQHVRQMPSASTPTGFDTKLMRDTSTNAERRTINRAQAFVRWELSKFISKQPTITAVPGSGSDDDVRSAYAAEQAWESISSAKNLRRHFSRSAWWMSVTGNGFMKTEWDPNCLASDGQPGDIKFSNITPFHLFVPDLREPEVDNQPFLTFAYTKTKTWVQAIYAAELKGVTLTGSADSSASLIDEAYLNLQKTNNQDCVIVQEMWIKPGAHKLFPNGGLVIMVEQTLLGVWFNFPYAHGQFPVTHFGHLDTGGFYNDSPLRDLNQLQREYNALRTRISETAKRMASLQILAPQGSVVASKWTNQIGQVVTYKPGVGRPEPFPVQAIPQYVLQQQDRIMQDWEDISGIRDVTTGNAPAGVSAGTALNYLQEAANSFHTPQFQEIEFGHENIAKQTLGLFKQFVDYPRAVKVMGADLAYDTMLVKGADISGGTDIRVEANSAAPVSQAANQARVMDMFGIGIINDPGMALKMLDVGGFQRMLNIVQVAERKAQRENMQMKKLSPLDIEQAQLMQDQGFLQSIQQNPQMAADPQVQQELATLQQGGHVSPPLMIPVDDFDDHPTHIATHNAFRMGQEYATLDKSVQQQIAMHVMVHQQYLQQQQMQQFLSQVPGDGTDSPNGAQAAQQQGPPPGGSAGPAAGDGSNGAATMSPTPGGP